MATRQKPVIEVDLSAFVTSARQHINTDYPRAIVNAFSSIAEMGADDVKSATRSAFDLHSNFITSGIKSLPHTTSQKKAAARALAKYNDFTAAVYLRGSASVKRSLAFMADHEYGGKRQPHAQFIAVPMDGVKSKSYRTSRGRVKKRWKPSELLQRFNSAGSVLSNGTTTNKGRRLGPRRKRVPGAPFLLTVTGGTTMVVRRKQRAASPGAHCLEFMYALKKQTAIKRRWRFTETVMTAVKNTYSSTIAAHVKRLPDYD